MGRGGGGGSSHHSSHSSSSHSHHSSSSSYRSSSSSSSHHSGGSYHSGSSYGGGGSGGGCLSTFITLFIVFGFIGLGFFLAVFKGEGGGRVGDFIRLERSTVQREALPESKCDPIDEWYSDDWGDWIDQSGEETALVDGLKYFYEKTGVQPYLWIMGEEGADYKSEGSLEELAESKYIEMFGKDEGHVLVIFREYPNESGNYICVVTPGYDAETQVLDEEAREILLDWIDYYYTDDSLNEGRFFEKSFETAADKMMVKQLSWKQIGVIIVVAAIVVVGIIITAGIIKKRKVAVAKQKAKQAQAEKDKKQIEFNQQKYNDALEKEYVSVECPNCGSAGNKIRKGTVAYCQFCGSAISVDMIGQAFIGDIFSQQQAQPQQQAYQQAPAYQQTPAYQQAPAYQQPAYQQPAYQQPAYQQPQTYQQPVQAYPQAPQAYPQAPQYQPAPQGYQQPPQNYQQPPQ